MTSKIHVIGITIRITHSKKQKYKQRDIVVYIYIFLPLITGMSKIIFYL